MERCIRGRGTCHSLSATSQIVIEPHAPTSIAATEPPAAAHSSWTHPWPHCELQERRQHEPNPSQLQLPDDAACVKPSGCAMELWNSVLEPQQSI